MADSISRAKLNVGLIGLPSRAYTPAISRRGLRARGLVAVADVDRSAVDRITGDFDIPRGTTDPGDVIGDPSVDAVVIVTPTNTHRQVEAAAAAGKAVFCEKPLSIALDEAVAIRRAVERSGIFFQMGFMRRFDRGFAAAKQRLGEGVIGDAVVFKSTSRDPFRPSVSTPIPGAAAA